MPNEFSRARRVADLVQRELAVLIQRGLNEPRLGLITISAVEVSVDLSHAKIYVTALGGQAKVDEVLEILNKGAGLFRSQLARRLSLRTVPKLRFIFDGSVERGRRLSALIDAVCQTSSAEACESNKQTDQVENHSG
ncbi:MAG: 30S ribosome-binding factor RbfA [Gammaproteobacteria bacterium]|nr:30S ribosome-binding factor RbfA [Gammaproteobacteria bacterium]MCI0590197.1 30S ribosome-binding factor RbfA [Gammaproteobacteria bacterium]